MIGQIRGILLEAKPPNLLVDVNGVGYEVQMPLNSFYLLPKIGSEITLFTHFVVREDGQFLFGFINAEHRTLFRSLIKVNGIGPKSALAILSAMEPDIFVQHVLHNEIAALKTVPGVGEKTAQRLVVEMRDKFAEWEGKDCQINNTESLAMHDAEQALVALGYKPQEARRAVEKYSKQNLASSEMIRLALKDIH